MRFLEKMERKFGKFAIPHLTTFIIVTYVTGYVLYMIGTMNGYDVRNYLAFYPPYIMKGQVWRIVSWILMPLDTSIDFWTLLMLFCIYQQGTLLERVWGDFKFNVYVFGGLLWTLLGGIILYAITGTPYIILLSTYYISLSVFLGLALTYPEMEFRFMFLIPIKAKYLVFFYGAYMLYVIIAGGSAILATMIIASGINMAIFFLLLKKGPHLSRRQRRTQKNFRQQMGGFGNVGEKIDRTTFGAGNPNPQGFKKIAVHKCAVCGRTELDDPNLEFRFCSKCNGNYEYCQDHLYTHTHVN